MFSIAATGIVVSVLHATTGMFSKNGLIGELVRIGGVGGMFALSL